MLDIAKKVFKHRALALELARRDILDRYLSQSIGGVWAILNPLLIMWLYVVLFTVVFPARLESDDVWRGVIYLLAGLVCWLFSAEMLNKSTSAIIDNASLVKQIVFPIETIPIKTFLVALFSFVISFSALLVILALNDPGALPLALVMSGAAILLHSLFLIGVAFLLSSTGTFLRDLKDFVAFFAAAGLFLAPILYFPERLDALPPVLKTIIVLNPFSHFVWIYQDSLSFGEFRHPVSWGVCTLLAVLTPLTGAVLFRRLSPQFGDVV